MPKRDVWRDRQFTAKLVTRLVRNRKRRRDEDGGEPVPADRGPRPLPLEGGAEAPLD